MDRVRPSYPTGLSSSESDLFGDNSEDDFVLPTTDLQNMKNLHVFLGKCA